MLLGSIGWNAPLHADFGSGLYDGRIRGIPFAVVSSRTRRVPVIFQSPAHSDRTRYPLPRRASVSAVSLSGEHHAVIVDRDTCRDYELFDANPIGRGFAWTAYVGAIFDLHSNRLRPAGWPSADAAGLPILPGLARYDEVARGVIDHALRFTAPTVRSSYIYPARDSPSHNRSPQLPPMGLRVRLKASVDIARLPRQARIIALALKRYGMILADVGPPWFVTGAPNRRWQNAALDALSRLRGSDFEVVDTRYLPRPSG